ncbi:MAG: hypothetical protein AAF654_08710 [Myxococcota bacterium]
MEVLYRLVDIDQCVDSNYRAQGNDQIDYAKRQLSAAGRAVDKDHIALSDKALEDTLDKLGGGHETVSYMMDCVVNKAFVRPSTPAGVTPRATRRPSS